MEIYAQSIETDTIILSANGYYSRKISFEEFIRAMVNEVNKEGLVKGISLNNNTIRMYYIDEIYGLKRQRDIILDQELINNVNFMRLLREFIAYYDSKRFELVANANKKIIVYDDELFSESAKLTKAVFYEYVSSGHIQSLNSIDDVKKIIVRLRRHSEFVYAPYGILDVLKTTKLKIITGAVTASKLTPLISFVAVACLAFYASEMPVTESVYMATCATSVSSLVVSVIAGPLLEKAEKKLEEKIGEKAMDELADKLEMIYFGDKIDQNSFLLERVNQPRRLR